MSAKPPTISVVVPVYNDEPYVKACLGALQAQTVTPHEILFVDNNCTDGSMAIARRYKNVKILHEPKQGLSYARNTGLNMATGDILLRIDADTVLPPTYIEHLQQLAVAHPDVAGFSGYGVSRYEFIPKISLLWAWSYFAFTKAYLAYPVLWGANMAIRKQYWHKAKKYLINNDMAVHEDQDVSLAIASVGGRVLVTKQLTVSVQMKAMFEYARYRKYGLMLQLLKRLDKEHPRYQLATRVPPLAWPKRALYWVATVWAVYAFYLVTFAYELMRKLRR